MATTVLYDGGCEFCTRSVRLLLRLDWRHRLTFADGRDPANTPPGVDPTRLMEEMYAVDPRGRVTHGFGAVRQIAWQLPLAWPVLPLLYLPGVLWLGQRLYLWIAKRRYHLVPCHDGACQVKWDSPRRHGGHGEMT